MSNCWLLCQLAPPSVAHVPMSNILTAFRDGIDQDSSLTPICRILQQLCHSFRIHGRKWFSERLGIEAISQDIGHANVFVTTNLNPRACQDVRRLIYKLEYGTDMNRNESFVKNTAQFTTLINKYAPFVAVYLYRKVKAITHLFFTKICGIQEKETKRD